MIAELHTKNGTFLKRFAVESANPDCLNEEIKRKFPSTYAAGFLVYIDF